MNQLLMPLSTGPFFQGIAENCQAGGKRRKQVRSRKPKAAGCQLSTEGCPAVSGKLRLARHASTLLNILADPGGGEGVHAW